MIHKILLLLKNQLNYLRDIIDFSFIIFLINCNDGKFRFWRRKDKDIRNVFRLKKELNYIAIKDMRNLFRQVKETKAIKDTLENAYRH